MGPFDDLTAVQRQQIREAHAQRTEARMTDQTGQQAIRTVARRVLANAVAPDPTPLEWENYPEIGEQDWAAVVAEVRRLAERTDVQGEHYESAYRHLAGRADKES